MSKYDKMTVDELNSESDRVSKEMAALREESRKIADVRNKKLADEEAAIKLSTFTDEQIKVLKINVPHHLKGRIEEHRKLRAASGSNGVTTKLKTEPAKGAKATAKLKEGR